jgi:hypothetical protein
MGLFKKKADPISERSKALNAQIASLEAQIKRLDQKLQHNAAQPKTRTSVASNGNPAPSAPSRSGLREPIFESMDHRRLHPSQEQEKATPDHYNDLGVRKYDLAAAWRRFRSQFRGPPASNPKLVTYLAAGSIKGLRPLRYEKRVARNRFIALFIVLVGLLWGILWVFVRTR